MMRFYGMSLSEYRSLSMEDSLGFWRAITVIEARDQLLRLQAADYPHLKKNDRSKIHRNLHRDAFPPHLSNAPAGTTEDLAKLLAKGLSGGRL